MGRQIKHTLFYFYKYSFKSIALFWLIHFLILLLFLILTSTAQVNVSFENSASFPSMIFIIIFSIYMFKNTFPHVIKLGVTRVAFSVAIYFYALILSFIMTALNYFHLKFFNFLIDRFAIEGFTYTGLTTGDLSEFAYGNVLINDWLVNLTLFLLCTLLGIVFYRFGMTYGTLISAILPLSLFIRPIGKKIIEIGSYLFIFNENYTPISFLILIVIIGFLIRLVVHRSSIIDQITKQT